VPSLKLNYKEVLSACSDQSFWTANDKHPQTVPDDPIADAAGNMDLGFVPDLNFGPQETAVTRDDCYSGGGRREASLLRYKEKRRARLFSKKIRYEVRKLNAEQRPRMRVSFNLHLFNLSFFLNLFSSWIIYSLETCALGLFSRQLNCFFHILTRE
jgi:hypothetical protein